MITIVVAISIIIIKSSRSSRSSQLSLFWVVSNVSPSHIPEKLHLFVLSSHLIITIMMTVYMLPLMMIMMRMTMKMRMTWTTVPAGVFPSSPLLISGSFLHSWYSKPPMLQKNIVYVTSIAIHNNVRDDIQRKENYFRWALPVWGRVDPCLFVLVPFSPSTSA